MVLLWSMIVDVRLAIKLKKLNEKNMSTNIVLVAQVDMLIFVFNYCYK